MEKKIDFVVLWVDGNDPEFIRKKINTHLTLSKSIMMKIICIVIVTMEHSIIGFEW